MYKKDRELFNKTARDWVKKYASPNMYTDKIKILTDMGFEEKVCKEILAKFAWDENLALNYLLENQN